MSSIVRTLLGWLGYRVEYVSEYGTHNRRYDSIDWHMGRPIHPSMSVAPPWAKRRIVKSGVRFVPMPCADDEEYDQLIDQCIAKLNDIERAAEASEAAAPTAEGEQK